MDSATLRRLKSHYGFDEWTAGRRSAPRYFVWRLPPDGLILPGWKVERSRSLALDAEHRWTDRMLSRHGRFLRVETYECRCADSALHALLGMLAQAEYAMKPWSGRSAGEVAFGASQSGLAVFSRGNLLVQVTGTGAPARTVRAAARKLDEVLTEPPSEAAYRYATSDVVAPAYDLKVRDRRIHAAADDREVWFRFVLQDGDALTDEDGIRWAPDPQATAKLDAFVLKGRDVVGGQRHEAPGDDSA
jgi:hypothetical protein